MQRLPHPPRLRDQRGGACRGPRVRERDAPACRELPAGGQLDEARPARACAGSPDSTRTARDAVDGVAGGGERRGQARDAQGIRSHDGRLHLRAAAVRDDAERERVRARLTTGDDGPRRRGREGCAVGAAVVSTVEVGFGRCSRWRSSRRTQSAHVPSTATTMSFRPCRTVWPCAESSPSPDGSRVSVALRSAAPRFAEDWKSTPRRI